MDCHQEWIVIKKVGWSQITTVKKKNNNKKKITEQTFRAQTLVRANRRIVSRVWSHRGWRGYVVGGKLMF